ncbi:MFS transporter [Kitasatospora sp. SolWspMP-SS2h]|uniref:MFS transporter n=1 Tax=Kitasatospora sp. SolWspMP-SS2h TaxID=1305729 RepID=UPI000DB991E1|nr:MFS transporter [Kitasatospora sp. SolWspMP-SS2h]
MSQRQKAILLVLLATQFMLAADFSILNVAVPEIGSSLHFSLSSLQWIVTAFALTAAGFTLIFGRVGDLLGRKRLFLGGMALLGLSSLLGGLAQTPTQLIVARVGQGLATAITTPSALALITTSFPEGKLRERAMGLNGALMSAGFTAGAILGGVLTGLLDWRWAFLINVVVAVAVLAAAPRLLTESRSGQRVSIDLPGSLTVCTGLVALVVGITRAGEHGWTETWVLVLLAAAAALLVAFWAIERVTAEPLLPVRLLARPTISWGNIGGLVTFTMMSSVVFLMTLYLQDALHYSPLVTGLAFSGLGTAAFFGGLRTARIIGRLGSRTALVLGLVIQGVSTAALLLIGTDHGPGLTLMIAATTVGGFGHVLSIVSFMVTGTLGVSDDDQGRATGITSMTQQVGITIGIPIISTLATSRIAAAGHGESAVAEGVRTAIAVDAGVVLLAALLIGLFLRKRHFSAAA